jgi:single-stranded DNA-specific DHH superfamily exonuclease
MEQLLNLINEIASNDEMAEVIVAIKKKRKELKAELTLHALKTFEVGDVVLCDARDGVHEATITKINRTTADIEIGKNKYTAPLSILKPMEVA